MEIFLFSIMVKLCTYLFGKIDFLFQSVSLLFLIDYLTKFFLDYKLSQISGKELIIRLFRKIGYFSIIIIAVILDHFLLKNGMIRDIVLLTILGNEMLSILNTCAKLGLQIPSFLKNKLNIFQTTVKETENEEK